MIDKSNFMGTIVFSIKYEAFVCAPIKDLEIICTVENIIKGYIICQNGPLKVAIEFSKIDNHKFEISGNDIIDRATNATIKKGDHLRVSIINIESHKGEKNILAICKLLNIADENDIKKYEQEQLLVTGNKSREDKRFI